MPQRQQKTQMRLQRLIAGASEFSRRMAEELILKGRVSVNGVVTTKMGTTVDPVKDVVLLDGKRLSPSSTHKYIAFYKPKDVIVSRKDPQERKVIWDYLMGLDVRLNSVGRLDYDSEGLLLLSTDGDFVNRLTHPKHEIWKTYLVKVRGVPNQNALKMLASGVSLEEGKTLPCKVRLRKTVGSMSELEVSIREGKNRQIRRMFEVVGHLVVGLKRMSIGSVGLSDLKPGQWRELSKEELREFSRTVNSK